MDIQLAFTSSAAPDLDVDLLAVVIDDPANAPAVVAELDELLGGSLGRELERERVKGDAPSSIVVTGAATGPQRVVLVGFGPEAEGRSDALRVAGNRIASAARASEARTVAIAGLTEAADVAALTSGATIGDYRIHHHRSDAAAGSEDKPRYFGIETLTLFTGELEIGGGEVVAELLFRPSADDYRCHCLATDQP